MSYPKFIITKSGYFRLGMVHQHKDLLQPGDICYGGGFYEFDYISNSILLHGSSYDYGHPKWNDIPALHVPDTYKGLNIVYSYYDGEKFIVRDHLNIDYY